MPYPPAGSNSSGEELHSSWPTPRPHPRTESYLDSIKESLLRKVRDQQLAIERAREDVVKGTLNQSGNTSERFRVGVCRGDSAPMFSGG
jgi:hypothetical protein